MPPPISASQVHLNEDIRNVMRSLLATHESTRRIMPDTDVMEAYTDGFRTSMLLVAEALNINLGIPTARHYLDG